MIGYIVGCQSFTGILREFFAPIRQKKKLPRPACQEQILLYYKAITQVASYCAKTS
jgi:hypothetical protein